MDPDEYTQQELSLMLDRAIVALERAEETGDEVRVRFARAWKAKVEAEIFREGDTNG